MQAFSAAVLPVTIAAILFFGLFRGVHVFDAFLGGAKSGFSAAISVLPSIVGLVSAITMLRASGAIDLLCHALGSFSSFLGFPAEVLPMAILRPISGGASVAVLQDVLTTYGPDSFAGRVASVISGSTETTFYTLTVYFAAVKAKDSRHTLKSALLADLCGILLSAFVVRLLLPN